MKTFIHSLQSHLLPFSNPLARAARPFFFALAFLPSILHLLLPDFLVTNPLTALGPVAAGCWLAAGLREIRVSYALLGALMTALLWAANWLMTANGNCCSMQ